MGKTKKHTGKMKSKELMVLAFLCLLAFVPFSSAEVPPTNYFGFIKNNNAYENNVVIKVYSDCFSNSFALLLETMPKYNKGYYDIDVPTDDSSTAVVEGCRIGNRIKFVFIKQGFNLSREIIISKTSVSERHDFNLDNTDEHNLENEPTKSDGGSSDESLDEANIKENTLNNGASPKPRIPILPINYFGFVFVDGKYVGDNATIKVYTNCFDNAKNKDLGDNTAMYKNTRLSLLKTIHTTYNRGYYDLYVNMDDPTTKIDEGCKEGDKIIFAIDGLYAENNTNTIIVGSPGNSIKHNVYFLSSLNARNSAKIAIKEMPLRISNKGNYSLVTVLLFFVLIALIVFLIHEEKTIGRKHNIESKQKKETKNIKKQNK